MQLKISRMCMFLTTVKENWEASHQMYSKVQDVTQIYELKTKMNTTKQGTLSITEYYNTLKGLWLELDCYQNF